MRRRSFLARVGGTAALGALAGCSSPLRTHLDASVSSDGDGATFVRFTADGGEKAQAYYLLGNPHDGRVRFRVNLSHSVNAVRSFRLRFRPDRDPGEMPLSVLLERPGGHPFPLYRFQQGDGYGWTLFEVPDLEAQAPGSFTVEFWFQHVEPDTQLSVTADLRVELDAGFGRTLVGEKLATIEGQT